MKSKKSIFRSIGVGLAVVLGIIVYAYAFQVTDVNFETTRSDQRITQLTRVLRALAKPDLLTRETTEEDIMAPFYLPCPASGEMVVGEESSKDPYLKLSVPCASAKEMITVEGYNFPVGMDGPINFLAASGVKKQLGNFEVDNNGYFSVEIEVPNRQPVEEAQYIVATIRTKFGPPIWTDTAKATWDKIIETVFIAFLATTIGTIISIPLSFYAARNLMKDATSTLTNLALSLIGWPVGIWAGLTLTRWVLGFLDQVSENGWICFIFTIILSVLVYLLVKKGLPTEDIKQPTQQEKMVRSLLIIFSGILAVGAIIFFGMFTNLAGKAIIEPLGVFGFLGNALYLLGDIVLMLVPILVAFVVGGVVASILNNFGQSIQDRMASKTVKLLNILFSMIAFAILFVIVMAGINWFYQINDPTTILYIPLGLGALVGLVLAAIVAPKQALPSGLVIYTVIRTILNATRSIEPLVMAIVFVIWVGIGPFAGSLALALHTVAALTKLYSEQVESIDDGPLEAIQATGANRLQTIVYAVIPQIIPPYISFTMYRWDINVRMSTIIGFVGGGGIGFLLQQNINLLNYRAASVQMLAIAVVVATMDYISSEIRERFV